MIKAIIFDWGGVLEHCNNKIAAKELAKKYGCGEKKLFKRIDSLENKYSIGQNCVKYYEILAKEFEIPKTILRKTLNKDNPYLVFNLAKKLKKKGYKVFILSNQMNSKTTAIRKHNNLRFFNHCFFSNEIKMMKPHKNIFKHFIKKTGLDPNFCVFIDDHNKNVIVAKKLGFKSILFQNLNQLNKDLALLNI